MTASPFSDHDLEAFLDEALPAADAVRLEQALRDDEPLRTRLAAIIQNRDVGEHSLGAVWRRSRLSCFDRSTLGAYLLGVLSDDESHRVRQHLELVGCRYCAANLDDLRGRMDDADGNAATSRSRRIFDSSIGRLRNS